MSNKNNKNKECSKIFTYIRNNSNNKLKNIESLITKGCDLNIKDKDGNTALIVAVENNNNIDIVKLLIDKGANLDIKNKKDDSALLISIYNRNYNAFKILIEKGAKL